MPVTVGTCEEKSVRRVVSQNYDKDQCEIQKVSMDVLQDQREFTLAAIFVSRFADGACYRVGPKRFVIGSAVVIASEPKSAGGPQDQESGCRIENFGYPGGPSTEPCVFGQRLTGRLPDQGRIHRR